jgi:hypothetical protein
MRGVEVRMNNIRMHMVLRKEERTLWPSSLGAGFLWDKKRPPGKRVRIMIGTCNIL